MFFYITALHIKARMIATFIVVVVITPTPTSSVPRLTPGDEIASPQTPPPQPPSSSSSSSSPSSSSSSLSSQSSSSSSLRSSYRHRHCIIVVRKNTIRMQLPPTVQLICPITCNPAIRASNCQSDQTILSVHCSYD